MPVVPALGRLVQASFDWPSWATQWVPGQPRLMCSPFRAQLFFCQSLLLSLAAKTKSLSHGLERDYHHQKMEDSFSPHQNGGSFYGNHGDANWWWGTRERSGIGSKETTVTWITLYRNTRIITSLSRGGHSQEMKSGEGYKDSYSQPGNHEIHSQTVLWDNNKETLTPLSASRSYWSVIISSTALAVGK